jgi:intein/homing endonuclease
MVCNKKWYINPTTHFVSEYGETYKIKTKLGIELEGSWKHPVLIKRNGEEIWSKMDELIGDKPIINMVKIILMMIAHLIFI